MIFKHPLLQRAHRYEVKDGDPSPKGFFYDAAVGAWRSESTGELWAEMSGQDRPRTKKQDIETGEDQKGA
jgi:hypothetical protein